MVLVFQEEKILNMRVPFYNLVLDLHSAEGVANLLEEMYRSEKPNTVFFLNAHCFNVAQSNSEYFRALHQSDLVLNDGIGIKIAASKAGIDIIENLNGTDLIPRIIGQAYTLGKGIYLLGGKEGIAKQAATQLENTYPGIRITGSRSGYFSAAEEKVILAEANRSDLLILGMGVPFQETWAHRNKENLKNVKLIVAGGAILDFLSGNVKRAPEWLRKLKMEWIFRLLLEPRRLWKRYLIGNIRFFIYLIKLKKSLKNE